MEIQKLFCWCLTNSNRSSITRHINTGHCQAHDLQIKDDNFTMEEFKKVKTQLKEGSDRTGSDNIQAELLKKCNLYEIILEFSNNLLKKDDKPMKPMVTWSHDL